MFKQKWIDRLKVLGTFVLIYSAAMAMVWVATLFGDWGIVAMMAFLGLVTLGALVWLKSETTR